MGDYKSSSCPRAILRRAIIRRPHSRYTNRTRSNGAIRSTWCRPPRKRRGTHKAGPNKPGDQPGGKSIRRDLDDYVVKAAVDAPAPQGPPTRIVMRDWL